MIEFYIDKSEYSINEIKKTKRIGSIHGYIGIKVDGVPLFPESPIIYIANGPTYHLTPNVKDDYIFCFLFMCIKSIPDLLKGNSFEWEYNEGSRPDFVLKPIDSNIMIKYCPGFDPFNTNNISDLLDGVSFKNDLEAGNPDLIQKLNNSKLIIRYRPVFGPSDDWIELIAIMKEFIKELILFTELTYEYVLKIDPIKKDEKFEIAEAKSTI
jgi:hypothetical protein